MSQQKMRWKTKDYLRLEKAVNDFNIKIKKLQNEENKGYLPNLANAQEIKKGIYSKYELNRVLNSLRAFNEKGAENLYTTQAGEKITEWEKQQLKKMSNIRIQELEKEIKPYKEINKQGFSLTQMGNTEARRIQANIDRLKEFEKRAGEDFKRLKKYINLTGTKDYNLKKADIYRKNYMNTIEKQFSHLDGYKELKRAFNNHKNPTEFFKWIEQTGDINIIDIHYESNNTMSQEQFYNYLEKLGIEIKEQVTENL